MKTAAKVVTFNFPAMLLERNVLLAVKCELPHSVVFVGGGEDESPTPTRGERGKTKRGGIGAISSGRNFILE